jgi:GTP cyclohydrolase I
MKEFDKLSIIAAWSEILRGLGIDYLNDRNFFDTPKRIADMYDEVFNGLLDESLEDLEDHLTKTFPCSYDQMIVEKGIETWGMCPHHFLPVKYMVDVGYLPSQDVLGLSKLPRVVQVLSRRPVLQEQFTEDIVNYLERVLKPRGAMVKVTGLHLCMVIRGSKSHGTETITSALTGVFRETPSLKEEFLSFVK